MTDSADHNNGQVLPNPDGGAAVEPGWRSRGGGWHWQDRNMQRLGQGGESSSSFSSLLPKLIFTIIIVKACGQQCVVFNCSDGLDYHAMGKFFKGCAQSGAWACFDEFNRIHLGVLSVVAQQIHTIQHAVANRIKSFQFEGVELTLNPSCSIFITMNTSSIYSDRDELPDNLKLLFRPVAMTIPEFSLIAEVSLYAVGFVQAKSLARKIVQTYKNCSEQLSALNHYDYSMRAVRAVLDAATKLKLTHKEDDEEKVVLKAITDINLPKFSTADTRLFQNIIRDLFPKTALPKIDNSHILEIVKERCAEHNLQASQTSYFLIRLWLIHPYI